jgi:hypothetical protein
MMEAEYSAFEVLSTREALLGFCSVPDLHQGVDVK